MQWQWIVQGANQFVKSGQFTCAKGGAAPAPPQSGHQENFFHNSEGKRQAKFSLKCTVPRESQSLGWKGKRQCHEIFCHESNPPGPLII